VDFIRDVVFSYNFGAYIDSSEDKYVREFWDRRENGQRSDKEGNVMIDESKG
jgi:hypothetical protein